MTYPHWEDDANAAWHQHQMEQQRFINDRKHTMKISELVPTNSQFLTKDDVGTGGKNLTISGFKRVSVKSDGGEEQKVAVLWEQSDYKPFLLNKTNSQLLEVVLDVEDTADAKGKVVNVYHDRTISFGGKVVGGLRVRAATGPAEGASAEAGGDDIPF